MQPLKNLNWGYRKDTVCVFNIPDSAPEKPKAHKLTQEGQRYLRTFMGTGALPKADGIYDNEWKLLFRKAIQTALNKDHALNLKVDGKIGSATKAALKKYAPKYGEKSYLVSVLEIGLYLNNKNPNGYETPGLYGDGVKGAISRLIGTDGRSATLDAFTALY